MASRIEDLLADIKKSPTNVRFTDACKLANHYFGAPTQHGTSHRVWKMPWPGNPRVNMQGDKGKAKAYQVRQLLEAIERLGASRPRAPEEATAATKGKTEPTTGRERRSKRR